MKGGLRADKAARAQTAFDACVNLRVASARGLPFAICVALTDGSTIRISQAGTFAPRAPDAYQLSHMLRIIRGVWLMLGSEQLVC